MWSRNPISPARRTWLTQYLHQKLKKNQQLERLPLLLSKLEIIGDADPTVTGDYCKWILGLLLKRDIDLPEDTSKLFELLTVYHRVKRKLPIEFRQIEKFTCYSQLRITLMPMIPSLKSNSELVREGSEVIASESVGDALYQIYKLTTSQAASIAAKNSGWCICDRKTAAQYLAEGPLYLVTRNDTRYALAHLKSHQIMDINDAYFYPGNAEQDYQAIVKLFSKHLPEFICRKPFEDMPLFPHGLLHNMECQASIGNNRYCEESGCPECGFAVCASPRDDCDTVFCPKHGYSCGECAIKICDAHATICCDRKVARCSKCIQHCGGCNCTICAECTNSCDFCETHGLESLHCKDCVITCKTCDKVYCDTHADKLTCTKCDGEICKKCQEEGHECEICNDFFCKNCVGDNCTDCGSTLCPNCAISCPICSKNTCERCSTYCSHCETVFCEECSRNYCDICDKHQTRKVESCAVCADQDLCRKCSWDCWSCGEAVCEQELERCSCGRHTYCSNCAQKERCTCGHIACNLEDHYPCAYLMRWRR